MHAVISNSVCCIPFVVPGYGGVMAGRSDAALVVGNAGVGVRLVMFHCH